MHDEGVNSICGTDAGIGITAAGYSMHQELAFYQEAGMNNFEVLKTATINPSKAHKEFEQMGSNNPLENLDEFRKPEWVMVNGRKISEETLNEFADNARDHSNMVATALRYVEYLLVEK